MPGDLAKGKAGYFSFQEDFKNLIFIIFDNISAILVPMFGDQPRNAAMMENSGYGKVG